MVGHPIDPGGRGGPGCRRRRRGRRASARRGGRAPATPGGDGAARRGPRRRRRSVTGRNEGGAPSGGEGRGRWARDCRDPVDPRSALRGGSDDQRREPGVGGRGASREGARGAGLADVPRQGSQPRRNHGADARRGAAAEADGEAEQRQPRSADRSLPRGIGGPLARCHVLHVTASERRAVGARPRIPHPSAPCPRRREARGVARVQRRPGDAGSRLPGHRPDPL